jgi:hypothetical protein
MNEFEMYLLELEVEPYKHDPRETRDDVLRRLRLEGTRVRQARQMEEQKQWARR